MLEEVSEMIGLQVYTNGGIFLGNVGNVIVDVAASNIDGLFVTDTNPLLVEDSKSVAVPYRWIQSIGDIVILGYFPKRVALRKPAPEQKPRRTRFWASKAERPTVHFFEISERRASISSISSSTALFAVGEGPSLLRLARGASERATQAGRGPARAPARPAGPCLRSPSAPRVR